MHYKKRKHPRVPAENAPASSLFDGPEFAEARRVTRQISIQELQEVALEEVRKKKLKAKESITYDDTVSFGVKSTISEAQAVARRKIAMDDEDAFGRKGKD